MAINTPPIRESLPVSGNMATWPKSWANWFNQIWAVATTLNSSGVTGDRPTENLWVGRYYFDTTIGLPIWYTGSGWIDAAGNAV